MNFYCIHILLHFILLKKAKTELRGSIKESDKCMFCVLLSFCSSFVLLNTSTTIVRVQPKSRPSDQRECFALAPISTPLCFALAPISTTLECIQCGLSNYN